MLEIGFVTDYVCPYCLVGKEVLKAAIQELGIEAQILTLPMELTVEPAPRVDTWHDEVRKAHYQVLVEPAKKLGLDMKLPPNVVPRPYTRLAFEGHYFAEAAGLADTYDDAMYKAYFLDELDIENLNVLGDVAEKVGLDRSLYLEALESGKYSCPEKEACRYARETLGVKSIPSIFINGRRYQFTEYTKEEAIQMLKNELESSDEIHGCNEDGCF